MTSRSPRTRRSRRTRIHFSRAGRTPPTRASRSPRRHNSQRSSPATARRRSTQTGRQACSSRRRPRWSPRTWRTSHNCPVGPWPVSDTGHGPSGPDQLAGEAEDEDLAPRIPSRLDHGQRASRVVVETRAAEHSQLVQLQVADRPPATILPFGSVIVTLHERIREVRNVQRYSDCPIGADLIRLLKRFCRTISVSPIRPGAPTAMRTRVTSLLVIRIFAGPVPALELQPYANGAATHSARNPTMKTLRRIPPLLCAADSSLTRPPPAAPARTQTPPPRRFRSSSAPRAPRRPSARS